MYAQPSFEGLLADGPHHGECAALAAEIALMPSPDSVAATLLGRTAGTLGA